MGNKTSQGPKELPAIGDEKRVIEWVNTQGWANWEQAYRPYWRQIEENVRMLSGRQYDTYIEALGEFIDLSSWYSSNDERWRRYPVFNWLAHYFKLTLSKLTENPPVLSFMPATPDEKDARLAQVMQPVFKSLWRTMEMPELVFDLYGWLIVGARGILKLRWNPDLGQPEEWRAPAVVRLLGPDGGIQQRVLTNAPYVRGESGLELAYQNPIVGYDEQNNPVFQPHPQGNEHGLIEGNPHQTPQGDMDASVVSPASVIVPFGPEPFHRKPWYTHEYLMHVDEFRQTFGKTVEPDAQDSQVSPHIRTDFGSNYGMPSLLTGGLGRLGWVNPQALDGMCIVREQWYRSIRDHQILGKGRLIISTRKALGFDGVNPYWIDGEREKAVIPFEAFDLIRFPFRQEGHTDLEILNPIQRAVNRNLGGTMDAVDLNQQPHLFVDKNAGLDEGLDDLNVPGGASWYNGAATNGRPPVFRMEPGSLPDGSTKLAALLQNWMQLLGTAPLGSEGLPVTPDASGELQREVRFDTDRVWGATLRRHSYVWARVSLLMQDIMASCMGDDRILTLAGEDSQGWDFLTVNNEMFTGQVHVVPMPESAVMESRQDKQNRILQIVTTVAQIPDPALQQIALEAMNYPDLIRVLRKGGPAYDMAERENLELMLGKLPPVLPEQDHAVHIARLMARMQTIDFRDADPRIQQLFRIHLQMHEQFQALQQMKAITQALPVTQAAAMAQGAVAHVAQASHPQPPATDGGAPAGADPQRRMSIMR